MTIVNLNHIIYIYIYDSDSQSSSNMNCEHKSHNLYTTVYFLLRHQQHFCMFVRNKVFTHLSVCLYFQCCKESSSKVQKGFGKMSRGGPWHRYEIWNRQKDRKGLGKHEGKKPHKILLFWIYILNKCNAIK